MGPDKGEENSRRDRVGDALVISDYRMMVNIFREAARPLQRFSQFNHHAPMASVMSVSGMPARQ